jgi:hypothetical protein
VCLRSLTRMAQAVRITEEAACRCMSTQCDIGERFLPFLLEYLLFQSVIKDKQIETIILPLVLYGYKTWAFVRREEQENIWA